MGAIFDTHAHYTDSAFDRDRDYLLGDYLPAHNIKRIMLAGCNMTESRGNIALAKKYDYICAAAGFHPEYVYERELTEEDYRQLCSLLETEDFRAVGEIGLDYHYEGYNKEWQAAAFRRQLEIAKDFDLPVIIHARDATKDYLDILTEYKPRGVVHCFGGSRDTAEYIVEKLGMYVGFTGAITFSNAKKVLPAVEYVPDDRIVFETDAPYMAPDAYKEKKKPRPRCISSMIDATAQRAAEIRGCDTAELIDRACENGEILFGLKD